MRVIAGPGEFAARQDKADSERRNRGLENDTHYEFTIPTELSGNIAAITADGSVGRRQSKAST